MFSLSCGLKLKVEVPTTVYTLRGIYAIVSSIAWGFSNYLLFLWHVPFIVPETYNFLPDYKIWSLDQLTWQPLKQDIL